VLATAMLRMSEPDASALLGVSEGEGRTSTFLRCRVLAARIQATGRNPGTVVEHPSTPRISLSFILATNNTQASRCRWFWLWVPSRAPS